jgi:predicted amino acid dehydrogenase
LKSLLPWIPPRTVSRFAVNGGDLARSVEGIYVDAFLAPEALAQPAGRALLRRVEEAITAAEREGARIATLGGFTSILYEVREAARPDRQIAITTGNSLTAALIVRGVERALEITGRNIANEAVLIIGATGDVGSACARSLAGRAGRLLLTARNGARLEREACALAKRADVEWSTDVRAFQREAQIVITVASVAEPAFAIADCRDGAIICDAGYPKNMYADGLRGNRRLFMGGMGRIAGGFCSHDGMLESFYRFPLPEVAHGCILEGGVLALAGRFEAFSSGRGNILPERVNEIWALAQAHGVSLAPLFDEHGLWPEEESTRAREVA